MAAVICLPAHNRFYGLAQRGGTIAQAIDRCGGVGAAYHFSDKA